MIRYPWRYSAALAAMGLAVAACGEGPGGTDGHEGTASIRLMNTASGTAGLDLVVGGKLVAGGVQYEQASAAVTVPDGEQTLAVRRSGEQNVLTSKAVTLVSGGKYTLMVSGTASALVLTSTSVVDTGQARADRANLRIINISTIVIPTDSSQAPAPIPLNVYIAAPGAPLSGAASQLSLDARVSSYSTLMYFDPGTLEVRFVRPGSTDVVADTGPIVVGAGQVRAVTLQRQADGSFRTSVVVEP